MLNSVIGPGGVRLSGGETQRICIARALISKYGPLSSSSSKIIDSVYRYTVLMLLYWTKPRRRWMS